jgi:hypothetical protein
LIERKEFTIYAPQILQQRLYIVNSGENSEPILLQQTKRTGDDMWHVSCSAINMTSFVCSLAHYFPFPILAIFMCSLSK